jgi:pyruvate dehydrogenase (quinone)
VDPYEPPMPATITLEQAAHLAESLIRGTPNRLEIIETITADRWREVI